MNTTRCQLTGFAVLILCRFAVAGLAIPPLDCSYIGKVVNLENHSLPGNCCLSENVKCDMGSVVELQLSNLNLNGRISGDAVRHLKNLTSLDLHNNSLIGSISSEIWELPKLLYLNLSSNNFSGAILLNTSHITVSKGSLQVVDLSRNKLTGNFSGLCDRFRNLSFLDVHSNSFSSFGSMLPHCMSLQALDTSFNELEGEIPATISHLNKLRVLRVSYNSLSGSIPEVKNLSYLQTLDLSFNNLSGFLPTDIFSLHNLTHLNVSHNTLEGSIDATVWYKFGPSAFYNNRALLLKDEAPAPAPSSPSIGSTMSGERLTLSTSSRNTSRLRTLAIAGIVAAATVVVIIILATIILRKKRRRMRWVNRKVTYPFVCDNYTSNIGPFSFQSSSGTWVANVNDPASVILVIFEKPLLSLTFADLLQATSSFDKMAEIGDGPAPVYKGVLPGVFPGDAQVAIKVLTESRILKYEEALQKFEALGKIRHCNLVPLLGYCIVGEEKLLIYKFMYNGNLYNWLHTLPEGNIDTDDSILDTNWENSDCDKLGKQIEDWETRQRIALGTARALAFLHHGCSPQIVHGNVSSSNILLDEHFEPHLADCGLSELSTEQALYERTKGYRAPEYRNCSNPTSTTRGDVYSFGVVLLELVTAKAPLGDFYGSHNFNNLVSWVRYLVREKKGVTALDPKLVNEAASPGNTDLQMLETLRIAFLCTAESPAKRVTMQQVVGLLKDAMERNCGRGLSSNMGC